MDAWRGSPAQPRAALASTLRARLAELPWLVRYDRLPLRTIAVVCVALAAVVLAYRANAAHTKTSVVVFTRDLSPGHRIAADDLASAKLNTSVTAASRVENPQDAVDHTLATAVRAGEVVTDVRLMGSAFTTSAGYGTDGRIVPIQLRDSAIARILRGGDVVDVVALPRDHPNEQSDQPRILFSGATIVGAAEPRSKRDQADVVFAAMPSAAAHIVAAAALQRELAVVMH